MSCSSTGRCIRIRHASSVQERTRPADTRDAFWVPRIRASTTATIGPASWRLAFSASVRAPLQTFDRQVRKLLRNLEQIGRRSSLEWESPCDDVAQKINPSRMTRPGNTAEHRVVHFATNLYLVSNGKRSGLRRSESASTNCGSEQTDENNKPEAGRAGMDTMNDRKSASVPTVVTREMIDFTWLRTRARSSQ